jgi:hypothetical protein
MRQFQGKAKAAPIAREQIAVRIMGVGIAPGGGQHMRASAVIGIAAHIGLGRNIAEIVVADALGQRHAAGGGVDTGQAIEIIVAEELG